MQRTGNDSTIELVIYAFVRRSDKYSKAFLSTERQRRIYRVTKIPRLNDFFFFFFSVEKRLHNENRIFRLEGNGKIVAVVSSDHLTGIDSQRTRP